MMPRLLVEFARQPLRANIDETLPYATVHVNRFHFGLRTPDVGRIRRLPMVGIDSGGGHLRPRPTRHRTMP